MEKCKSVPGSAQVHLVSEHIWCDEFLVRSFYLKNLQTNETRTVTQFHFVAWPDLGVPASIKVLLDFRRYCMSVIDGQFVTWWSGICDAVVNRL